MANLTFVTGTDAGTSSYVRVGHNSSNTNPDAVWSFSLTSTGNITSVKFTLTWNNTSAGTGWSSAYNYVFAVSSSNASGSTAYNGTVLGRTTISLSGSSGTATVTVSGLSLTSGQTYYLRANFAGSTMSTMKAFSKTGGTVVVNSSSPKTCKVTFNRNSSTSDTTTSSKTFTAGTSGQTFPSPASTWTKTGYHAVGWSWDRDYGDTSDYKLNNSVSDTWINKYSPSTTLYLTWTTNKVNIKYDPNGGSLNSTEYSIVDDNGNTRISKNSSTVIQIGRYGSNVAPLSNTDFGLYKEGYTFSGWQLNTSETVMVPNTSYGSTKFPAYANSKYTTAAYNNFNCLLTAIWVSNTYTITYDTQSGTIVDPQTKHHGEDVNITSTIPTRSPYLNTYTISLYTSTAESIEYNCRTVENFIFTSWNTSTSGDGEEYLPGSTYSDDADITLYAIWNSYKDISSIVLPDSTSDYKECIGWAKSSTATTPDYPVGYEYTPTTNGESLYAIYQEHTLTISFYGNGATGLGTDTRNTSTDKATIQKIVKYSNRNDYDLPDVEEFFTKTGYTKYSDDRAWIVRDSTSGVYWSDYFQNIPDSYFENTTNSINLYANWKIIELNITLIDTKNNTTTGIDVDYGNPVGELPSPTYAGYIFKGWQYSNNTLQPDTIIYASATYQAVWEPITIVVTLDPGEGEISTTQVDVKYDQPYPPLPSPTLSQNMFVGWYLDPEFTQSMPAKVISLVDHILYAKYTQTILGYYNGEAIYSIHVGTDAIISCYRGDIKLW